MADLVLILTGAPAGYPTAKAADTNGDGILRQGEFLPDLNGDGRVAWFAGDDFDNRAPEEMVDRNYFCRGCLTVSQNTRGSIWTDLALSNGQAGYNWPDENGPDVPNNATFVFDFTVAKKDIAPGASIFLIWFTGITMCFRPLLPSALPRPNHALLRSKILVRMTV